MKQDDVENMLGGMNVPQPDIQHHKELKIPLLSYKKSSKAGFYLLILPAIIAVIGVLKFEMGIVSPFVDSIRHFFRAIDDNAFFTFLIPLIVLGLPLLVMVINLMAFCHFAHVREKNEYLITIKVRPLNMMLFLFSFAMLVYFFLPDRVSF